MPVDPNTPDNRIRYAPSFQRYKKGEERSFAPNERPYTAISLGKFLGLLNKRKDGLQPATRLLTALNALELIVCTWGRRGPTSVHGVVNSAMLLRFNDISRRRQFRGHLFIGCEIFKE